MTTEMRGLEFYNPSLPQITEDGLLCDLYGEPYPEAIQVLYANVLPTLDASAAALVRNAMNAHADSVREAARRARYIYSCSNCRDGKDLPQGYMCRRCGAEYPRST